MDSTGHHAQSAAETKCVARLKELFPPTLMDAGDVDFLCDDTYLRFARARGSNLKKAEEMLAECIEWRRNFKPYSITAEDVEQSLRQSALAVTGRCLAGRPVVVMTLGTPNKCEVVERVKHIVYIMEEFRRKKYGELTWLVDFSELGKHPRDPRSAETRKKCTKILNAYYPCLLGLMLLFRTPWYIKALLAGARLFMDKETYRKIHVVGSDKESLLRFIPNSSLLSRFGGTFSVEYNVMTSSRGILPIEVNEPTADDEEITGAKDCETK